MGAADDEPEPAMVVPGTLPGGAAELSLLLCPEQSSRAGVRNLREPGGDHILPAGQAAELKADRAFRARRAVRGEGDDRGPRVGRRGGFGAGESESAAAVRPGSARGQPDRREQRSEERRVGK